MIGAVRPLTIRSQARAGTAAIMPGPGDLALGEDADELAVVERPAGLAERLEDHLRAAAAGRSGSPASTAGTGPGAAAGSTRRRPRTGPAGRSLAIRNRPSANETWFGVRRRAPSAGHVAPARGPGAGRACPPARSGGTGGTRRGPARAPRRSPPARTTEAPRNVPRGREPGAGQGHGQHRAGEHAGVDQHVRQGDHRAAAVVAAPATGAGR